MSDYDIIIYVCHNVAVKAPSLSPPGPLGHRAAPPKVASNVVLREVPCSGKTDVLYLLRAFEGGARGVAIITCPLGECRLAEGNYRAQVRVRHVGRLLDEIGLDSERLILLHSAPGAEGRDVPALIEQAVERLSALPDNPMRGTGFQPVGNHGQSARGGHATR